MDDTKKVVEPSGDRFFDVVENVKLSEAASIVLYYVKDIVNNDAGDIEAKNCLTVIESLKANALTAIGDAIE